MVSVASQFQQKWMHTTKCPEVRAVYKIVSTEANLAKYEQYLFVSLIIIDSSRWLTHMVTAIGSKPSMTLPREINRAETRDADGTERQGSAGLEIKG